MLKIRAWVMFMAMCALLFALSGCGGGSLDGDVSEDTAPNPVSVPDTYNTSEVLSGIWSAINSTYSFSAENFSFSLISARLSFDSINMSSSVADALITSRQEWYADYTSGDTAIDLGIQSLGLDFDSRTGRMIHQQKDKWRCNVSADSRVVMNITVSSDKIISVNYQGVTPALYRNRKSEYNFTLNFRKEE